MINGLINLSKEFYPKGILDIGANQGYFARMCYRIWPKATILMIEGNDNCEEDLKLLPFEYKIALLSNQEKEVIFYIDKDNSKSTGSSYYKENTHHFDNANEIKKSTVTLDNLLKDEKRIFDFIKIDTQGSELDILRGSEALIKNIKYILLEISTEIYNIGAPLYQEVVDYMQSINFTKDSVIEEHLDKNGKCFQVDIIFKRNN